MIEIIHPATCIGCNLCVDVCPTRVFDRSEQGAPVIARKGDCQTCFMCELYCPVDAMYVAPEAEESVELNYEELAAQGLIGSYKTGLGWGRGKKKDTETDAGYQILKLYFSD